MLINFACHGGFSGNRDTVHKIGGGYRRSPHRCCCGKQLLRSETRLWPPSRSEGCARRHTLSEALLPDVLWSGIYRSEGAGLDCRRWRENSPYRTRMSLGAMNIAKASTPGSGMNFSMVSCLYPTRGPNSDRTMARSLQHREPPWVYRRVCGSTLMLLGVVAKV